MPVPPRSPLVVLVGVGGVGAPAALALAEAGASSLRLVDDDVVDATNLHRQILFRDEDVGRPKLEATRDALLRRSPSLRVELRPGRATPDTALALVADAAVVIDASDNFPTRFLLSDACALVGVPVVHAAAIRWTATVLFGSAGGPCYRCLFEDLPDGDAPDCATAGIVGPVCGVAGAIAADMALAALAGATRYHGRVATFDGRTDELRLVAFPRRPDCPTCAPDAPRPALAADRYVARAGARACEAP
jgi:adenylyltransferase/sulfurtransferase